MSRKWLIITSVLLVILLIWFERKEKNLYHSSEKLNTGSNTVAEPLWSAPDSNSIPLNDSGILIRYGKKLIAHTSSYFGPKGSIGHLSNGMNCQNCHLEAGTKLWAGNFGRVASIFPRFSDRKAGVETVNQRIRDCFERSMNGTAPDSNSLESKAMVAYLLWVGQGVPKGKKPRGTELEILPFPNHAADTMKGRIIFAQKCQRCHGANGEGKLKNESEYLYPPLWGSNSYNQSAGLFRLSKFAGFIKDNMPFGSDYKNEQLNNEEAWDLAAFVNSQVRPGKKFKQDWPNIKLKPVDHPFGPYADSFSEYQHKYGPFSPIAEAKKTASLSKSSKTTN